MSSKRTITKIPENQVLCADCGHPVIFRRVILLDCPVTSGGAPQFQHEYENHDTEQEYGLCCENCECFITNRYGYNADYDEVPTLLKEGRLKLMRSPKKKTPVQK